MESAHPLHALGVGLIVGVLTQSVVGGVVVGGGTLWWMRTYGHTLGPFAVEDEAATNPFYYSPQCYGGEDCPQEL